MICYRLYRIYDGQQNYTIMSQIQTSQKKHTGRAKEKRERGTRDETSFCEYWEDDEGELQS
jgi:hypothetical protein